VFAPMHNDTAHYYCEHTLCRTGGKLGIAIIKFIIVAVIMFHDLSVGHVQKRLNRSRCPLGENSSVGSVA